MSERGRLLYGQKLDNLRNRDLAILAVPLNGGRSPSFMERWLDPPDIRMRKREYRFPTYKAVSGERDFYELYYGLEEAGLIADKKLGEELGAGLYTIPAIDQLALSKASDVTVLGLTSAGLGIWPVREGLGFDGIDLRKLGIHLTPGQLEILGKAKDLTSREVNGLWFRADLKSLPGDVGYKFRPRLSEVLSAFESFVDQEGRFPHSGGEWFPTATGVEVSLQDAYERVFINRSPSKIFLDMVLGDATYKDEVKRAMKRRGPAYYQDGFCTVTKKNKSLQVNGLFGDLGYFHSEDRGGNVGYFYTKRRGGTWVLENGLFKKRNLSGETTFSVGFSTIIEEMKEQVDQYRDYFSNMRSLKVAVSSDKQKGVKLGVFNNYKNSPRLRLSSVDIDELNLQAELDAYVAEAVSGLERIYSAGFPVLVPDITAEEYLREVKLPRVPYAVT